MEKASVHCRKCNGRILSCGIPKSTFIDLTCMGCGWSRDVPGDVWKDATKASLRQIIDKADRLEF
jgi:hypothetical protein